MHDGVASGSPTIAARIRRAAVRVLPVLLVAGGIAWWSQAQSARCDRLFDAWRSEFDRSLRDGEPQLPAPANLADPLLAAPIASAFTAGVAAAGVEAASAIEPGESTGFARVRWNDRDGAARWIELRCDGASVTVSGIGFEPAGEESSES